VSRPADEHPTTVLPQQTVEQPSVTTSPSTGRAGTWHSRIPARIGRARSSTVIIGALFVLLGGLNAVLPQEDSGTTQVVLPSGKTVDVPNSAIPSEDRPTPTPTTPDPTGGVPVPTSAAPTDTRAPSPTPDDEEPTTTAPTSSPRDTSPTTSAPTSTSTSRSTPTTSAPSTSAARSSAEPTAEETAGPTG
jgi:hypothetical protein